MHATVVQFSLNSKQNQKFMYQKGVVIHRLETKVWKNYTVEPRLTDTPE